MLKCFIHTFCINGCLYLDYIILIRIQCLNFAIKSYSIKNNIQFTVFENIFLIFIDELCIIVYGGKIVTFHMGNRISLYIIAIANVYESGNI